MRRGHRLWGLLTLGLIPLLVPGIAGATHRDEEPVLFSDSRLKIEVNATDGDAGVQLFLDGESWKEVRLYGPDGRKLLEVRPRGVLRNLGLTELFFESSEPPFTELPFEEFQRLFPEGEYPIEGTTIDGREIEGVAILSHEVLDAPQILQPQDGAIVPADQAVIAWAPVAGAANYQVLVTRSDVTPKQVLSVDLPGTVHQLTVPPEFMASGVEYAVEVMALEDGGNQIFTEIFFTVA